MSDPATGAAAPANPFLTRPLPRVFAATALPIILVMCTNGALTVVDAMFLGRYVGADAVASVTVVFPAVMLMIALGTLVSGGMSSILARHLGAGRAAEARAVFSAAQWLAVALGLALTAALLLTGRPMIEGASGGAGAVADMAWRYVWITYATSPLNLVLWLQSDALRNEGRAGTMALIGGIVTLGNIALDYVLIALAGWGVTGSALASVAAQAVALAIVLGLRRRLTLPLGRAAPDLAAPTHAWRDILALGAPRSLNLLGISLVAAAVVSAVGLYGGAGREVTLSAYGIITRVMSFAIMPVIGLGAAYQSILGNNAGAGAWDRADAATRIALAVALVSCAGVEVAAIAGAEQMARAFVADPAVIAEVARILPMSAAAYALSGPLMMVAMRFQALGDARRAGVLSLAKPYAFNLPLIFLLPLLAGEPGIWLAAPLAELSLLAVTVLVLARVARRERQPLGLFHGGQRG